MSSKNKKNKEKRCNSYHGMGLKNSIIKLKYLLYFNSALRQRLKREALKEIKDNTER